MDKASIIQPLGDALPDWTPPDVPPRALVLPGRYARLEPLIADTHAALLYRAYAGHDQVWTYLPIGPFSSAAQYHRWVREAEASTDPQFLAVMNKETGAYEGTLSYLNIAPATGSIELGFINFSPALQQTRAATEALYLTLEWAFEVGYRRFDWKCNALNLPSRRASMTGLACSS